MKTRIVYFLRNKFCKAMSSHARRKKKKKLCKVKNLRDAHEMKHLQKNKVRKKYTILVLFYSGGFLKFL